MFDAVIGIVAEGYFYSENSGGVRRFLWEFFFVLGGIGPWPCGDGYAFMGFEGGGA